MKMVIYLVVVTTLFFAMSFSLRESNKDIEAVQTAQAHQNFAEWCLKKFPAKNSGEKIVNLRHCVYVNSEFSVDKANEHIWKDKAGTAQWLLDYAQGKRETAPPMECSYRSLSLRGMLQSQGFQAKNIVVAQNIDNFNDHVVVEVLNPDTGLWQVEDPSYDAHFVLKKDKRPLSMQELMITDFDKIDACDYQGRCGWDYKTVAEKTPVVYARKYWNVAYSKEDNALYVARKRFDETKKRPVYGKMLSYCEWREKWCGNIIHLQ